MPIVRAPRRGEVWMVDFDPAVGAEIRKLRPAVVISVDAVGRLPLRFFGKPFRAQVGRGDCGSA